MEAHNYLKNKKAYDKNHCETEFTGPTRNKVSKITLTT